MAVTIFDVAKKAEVSQGTVSKVLNKKKGNVKISEATRLRVLRAVEELGYYPHAAARQLAMKRAENIGIIACRYTMPFLSNPFYSRIIEGIEKEAWRQDFTLSVSFTLAKDFKDESSFPKMVKGNHIDGLILMGEMDHNLIFALNRKKIPFILVDHHIEGVEFNCIISDSVGGAYKAVRYLIELGHKEIGFVSGPLERISFQERFEGYRRALKEAGIEYRKDWVKIGAMGAGYKTMREMLKLKRIPTAVFAANDNLAIGAMKAIQEKGLRIPQDISVAGFDDIDVASQIQPSLTTVRVPKYKMGFLSVREIIKKIKNKDKGDKLTKMILPTQLIKRASTVAPIR